MNQQQTGNAATRSDEDLEKYIKISADSIAELRRTDVFRVISAVHPENIDGVTRGELATFIATKRPDLVGEVTDIMLEEFPADGWTMAAATGNGDDDNEGDEGKKGALALDYHIADNSTPPFIGIVLDDDDRATRVFWDLPTNEEERADLELLVIGAVRAANESGKTTLSGLLSAAATHCRTRRVDTPMTPLNQRVYDRLVAAAAEALAAQPSDAVPA
ncbi:hypothetical protein [Paraburkholderia youngii]|uniref:hypothetical protein n=1 Tax=Paraburkholderia youngii TaxID=2782701 RepID=UPI003D245975